MKKLDRETLEALAELICGDTGPVYRTGSMLPKFFRNAGLYCPDHDGSTRKWWALARIDEYSLRPENFEIIIKRLADPKEYRGDPDLTTKAINRLNQILKVEGMTVELSGVIPKIREIAPSLPEKKKETSQTYPIPDFSMIIDDSSLNDILGARWKEALKCIESEAYLSGVIMMGSILEGVLLTVVHKNPKESNIAKSAPRDGLGNVNKFWDWTLSDMIDVAHDLGWIRGDVKQFSHALRDYRNMVHPWHQRAKGEKPDEDTCKICWQVVVAATNDLIRVFSGIEIE